MAAQPVWLDKVLMLALHDDVVVASGGAAGLRDEGLLESALARPINRLLYEGVDDLLELAATYAVGIASNHPFVDGNKRKAFMALGQFLEDNGVILTASPADATTVMLSVAMGQASIADLTE
jgi:death-on-curing protein